MKTDARFINRGSDEDSVNGRTLLAMHNAQNYSPQATSTESETQVSAHLKGIDLALRGVFHQILYVSTTGNDVTGNGSMGNPFASIVAAYTSITDASNSNRYVIQVGPGIFIENKITLPSYVSLEGASINATSIAPVGNHDVIEITSQVVSISNLTIKDAPLTRCGVNVLDCGDSVLLHKVSFWNCATGIQYAATTTDCFLYLEHVDMNLSDKAVVVSSSNDFYANLSMESFFIEDPTDVGPQIHVQGTSSYVTISSTSIHGDKTQIGLQIENGARVALQGALFDNCDVAILVPNSGDAPRIDGSVVVTESMTDLQILHVGTTGALTGSLDSTKVTVVANCPMALSFVDSSGQAGHVVLHDIYQGRQYSQLYNESKLIRESSTMGLVTGGVLSFDTGLSINVSAGSGFIFDQTDLCIREVQWAATPLLMTASSDESVFVNINGVVSKTTVTLDPKFAIVLGRVHAEATSVTFIDDSYVSLVRYGNEVEEMLRLAVKCLFTSGCLVTENVSARKLNMTEGKYFYGTREFSPAAKIAFQFYSFYHSAGQWVKGTLTDTVSNSHYDNGTGLASIPTSCYTKHVLYIVSEGANQRQLLVFGQSAYADLNSAITGSAPIPPPFFRDAVVPVVAIIMQEGVANCQAFIDMRPQHSYTPNAVITDHGGFTGLLDDDHTQYLLASGGRSMAGDLDMGSHAITNATTVNGVAVTAHKDRHLPGGADALTTGAPVSIGNSNAAGVANSFSRSDHVHQVDNLTYTSRSPRMNYTETTLNGTLTLTILSHYMQVFTGTATGFSVVLPDATTATTAAMPSFLIINNSSQSISIKNNGGVVLVVVPPSTNLEVILTSNATADGVWYFPTLSQIGGSDYQYYEDLTAASTTLTTFSSAAGFTTAATVAGVYYRLGFFFAWTNVVTNSDSLFRITYNGVTLGTTFRYEKSEAASQVLWHSGFFRVLGTGAAVPISLQFASETNGVSTTVQEARFEFWRVS